MMFQIEKKVFYMSSLFFLLILVFIATALLDTDNAYAGSDLGENLFNANCAVCHGVKGDSKGQVCLNRNVEKSGRVINTYSRDFTVGVFKFRSTPTGCLPTDNDIMEIIKGGIPKSFMPSFGDLSSQERTALLGYIKTFSERWETEKACAPIVVKKPSWLGSQASLQKGQQIYKEVKCWECHGYEGKGDGPKSGELKDDWGHKIVPFDFTTGNLKRGTSPEAIYITFTTGLDGSGMPSYGDSLKEEDRWHLVSYTLKLMGKVQ